MRRLVNAPHLSWRAIAALILTVAAVARLAVIAHDPGFRPYADAADYDRVAVSLASHGDYPPSAIAPDGGPSAYRPPAYPYLLAATYKVTGTTHSTSRWRVARALSALLSLLIVALTGLVAGLLWGRVAALAAMAIAAVYPPLVTLGDAMLAEPLCTVLVLAAVAATVAGRHATRPWRWAVLAGALVGLVALTRTNAIVIAVPLAAGFWSTPGQARRPFVPVAALLASVAVVIAPWCVRDALVFHRFVLISNNPGYTIAGTYNAVSQADRVSPASWHVPVMPPYAALLRHGRNEAQISSAFQSEAVRYAEHRPLYVAKVFVYNLGRMLGLQGASTELPAATESGISPGESNLDVYAFYLLGVLVIAAVMAGAFRAAPKFVWFVPVVLALSIVFVSAYMRYRFPIDPLLIVAVSYLAVRAQRARARAQPASLSTAIA